MLSKLSGFYYYLKIKCLYLIYLTSTSDIELGLYLKAVTLKVKRQYFFNLSLPNCRI